METLRSWFGISKPERASVDSPPAADPEALERTEGEASVDSEVAAVDTADAVDTTQAAVDTPAASVDAPDALGTPPVVDAPAPDADAHSSREEPTPQVHDLRALTSRTIVLRDAVQDAAAADDAAHGESELFLVLDDASGSDSPIAVHRAGRKLGHVPPATAGQLAPLLSRLPHDRFLVHGVVEHQSGRAPQMRVHIPRVPALRDHVNSLGH